MLEEDMRSVSSFLELVCGPPVQREIRGRVSSFSCPVPIPRLNESIFEH